MRETIGIAIPEIGESRFTVLAKDWLLGEWEPVVGRLVKIPFSKGDKEGFIVGTVLSYRVTNEVAAYLGMARNAGAFMERGEVQGLQSLVERKTHLVLSCAVMSVFVRRNGRWVRFRPDVPIPPFARCEWFTEEDLRGITRGQGFFYVGRIFGTDLPSPLHLEDFSQQNEAYHFVVAGVAGSGKSTLVKMLLSGYARNPGMNFFILDTAGEFARAFRDEAESGLSIRMGTLWQRLRRPDPRILGINEIALGSWEALEELLREHKVLEALGVKNPNSQRLGVEHLVSELRRKAELSELKHSKAKVLEVLRSESFLRATYSSEESQRSLAGAVEDPVFLERFWGAFERIAENFAKGRPTVQGLVQELRRRPGTTVVLDLSALSWGNAFKYVFIRDVVKTLTHEAMRAYREEGGANFNTLVVVEEAHRLVPPKGWIEGREQDETRRTVLRALTETRKAGLGWMLISTRLSNLDRAVYEEARVRIIGRGLSSGEDADRIRESYGPEVLNQYRTLPDPVDPLAERRSHVFMFAGPICVFSRETPEFVEVFGDLRTFYETNFSWGFYEADRSWR